MHPAALVGIGIVAGALGTTTFASPLKKLAVKSMVAGMVVRDGVETLVDSARMEYDDIKAQAEYEMANAKAAEEKAAPKIEAAPKTTRKSTTKKTAAKSAE